MAFKLVYMTEHGKEFIRTNSEKFSSNVLSRMINVPPSEVMNVIITERLPMFKRGKRTKKIEI